METKRLLIRNFTLNDIDACYQCWGQDKALGRYILNYPMTDREQMAALVEGFLDNQDAWVLLDRRLGVVVGCITVDVPYSQLKIGELGYIIGEKYQKQGYAFEAAECIVQEYLFHRGFYLLEAKCNETNHASLKLLERLGFLVEAKLRGRRMDLLTGGRDHLVIASITPEEANHCLKRD
ncbi:MAG: GNAT family N-acetyltransferase [Lachnospiraceae bacterium]|nr:GNAT family N-acetyltransferase [Lachnospiraceae bacterium]MDE7185324.1 GNAT family N-acetyltransferase [Lachnospiraceae bacterium]